MDSLVVNDTCKRSPVATGGFGGLSPPKRSTKQTRSQGGNGGNCPTNYEFALTMFGLIKLLMCKTQSPSVQINEILKNLAYFSF